MRASPMRVTILLGFLWILNNCNGNRFNQELYAAVNLDTFERYSQEWNHYHQSWKNLDIQGKYCLNETQRTYFPICYDQDYLITNPENFIGEAANLCSRAQCLNVIDGCTITPTDILEYNPPHPDSTLDTEIICPYEGADAYLSTYSYGFDQGIPPTFNPIAPIRLRIKGQVYAQFNDRCQNIGNAKILAWQVNPTSLTRIKLHPESDSSELYINREKRSHNITSDSRNDTTFSLRDASCSAIQHSQANGSYSFLTLLPPSYGSPRSIFVQISADGFETLNTRIYFDQDLRLQQLTTLSDKEGKESLLVSDHVRFGATEDQQRTEKRVFPGTIALDPRVAQVRFVPTDTRSNLDQLSPFDFIQGYLEIEQNFVLSAKRRNVFLNDGSETPLIDIDGIWSEDNTGTMIAIETYGNLFTAREIPHKRQWDVVTGYLVDHMIKGVNFLQNYNASQFNQLRARATVRSDGIQVVSKALIDTLLTAQTSSTLTGTIVSSDSFNTVAFNDANIQDNSQSPGQYSNVNSRNPLASMILWSTDQRFDITSQRIWRRQDSTLSSGYRYIRLWITRIINDVYQSDRVTPTDINTGQLIINEIIFYEGYFQEREIPLLSKKMKTPRYPIPQVVTCSSFTDQDHHCFKAIDGDRTSASTWKTKPIRSKNNRLSTPQWLVLDLGEGYGIKPTGLRIICDVANAANGQTARGCPMTFQLQVSLDNIRYETIFSQDFYTFGDVATSHPISVTNPYYGENGHMFYFQSENSQGLNNGERCGSCLTGPNFHCHIEGYDSLCHSKYCNAKGQCGAPPICPVGKYLHLSFKNYEYPSYTCQLCPAGRYGNVTGLRSPYCTGLCEAGYYCPEGSISPRQRACGDESVYCPNGTAVPFFAPSGRKTLPADPEDTSGQYMASTRECRPGHYCIGGIEYPCPLGSYGNESALQTSACSGYCPPGTYCPEGSVVPTICPEGHFCSDGVIFRPCPAGTYGATKGLPSPECSGYCAKGHYCLEASTSPFSVPCPPGRYGDKHGLKNANCSGLCQEGYYCGLAAVTATENECGGSDRYCPTGSFQPTMVTPGYYTVGSDSPLTRPAQQIAGLGYYAFEGNLYQCPSGSFGNTTGLYPSRIDYPEDFFVSSRPTMTPTASPTFVTSQSPTMAPSLDPTFLPTAAQSDFLGVEYLNTASPSVAPTIPSAFTYLPYFCTGWCAPGYYCPLNSTSEKQVPCPAGRYGAIAGLTNNLCTDVCPLGHYCPVATVTPIPCRAGVFGGATGLIDATCSPDCHPTTGCNQTISLCRAGYYCPIGSITATQYECGGAEYYCPVGSAEPIPVTPGYYTINENQLIDSPRTRFDQRICEEGYFCVNGVKTPCPAGRYGNVRGLSSPLCTALCPPGHYCPEGSINGTTRRCPAGRYGATAGLYDSSCSGLCSAGYHCWEGSISPTQLACGVFDAFLAPDQTTWLSYQSLNASILSSPLPQQNAYLRNVYLNEFSTYLYTNPNNRWIRLVLTQPNNVYCPLGTSIPLTVLPGYYSTGFNATTRDAQVICPIGSYCDQGKKYACPGGRYGAKEGLFQRNCTGICTRGFYCPAGSTSSRQNPCPIGRYGAVEGLSDASCSGPCPRPLDCPLGSIAAVPVTST